MFPESRERVLAFRWGLLSPWNIRDLSAERGVSVPPSCGRESPFFLGNSRHGGHGWMAGAVRGSAGPRATWQALDGEAERQTPLASPEAARALWLARLARPPRLCYSCWWDIARAAQRCGHEVRYRRAGASIPVIPDAVSFSGAPTPGRPVVTSERLYVGGRAAALRVGDGLDLSVLTAFLRSASLRPLVADGGSSRAFVFCECAHFYIFLGCRGSCRPSSWRGSASAALA